MFRRIKKWFTSKDILGSHVEGSFTGSARIYGVMPSRENAVRDCPHGSKPGWCWLCTKKTALKYNPLPKLNVCMVLCCAFLATIANKTHADIISEVSMAWKNPGTTSTLMETWCGKATLPTEYHHIKIQTSCGGSNPVYNGYPLAFYKAYKQGAYTLTAGWYHFSSWRDDSNELHYDALSFTIRFNWSQMRRNK